MKRKVTFLLAALLLMCGLTWAQQITWTAADQGYENGQAIESVTFDSHVSAEFFAGTNNNAPKYYNTGAAIRCYANNYFTVTSDYFLTEIVLGFGSGDGSNVITTDVGTYDNGTWTGSTNEVTFTIGGTSGNRRIASFAISYSESGAPAPTITIENNNDLAFDATSGSFNFTVNNPVSGGTMTVATEEEWISNPVIAGSAVNFTTTTNQAGSPRQGVITLTYTYGEQTVTKSVTVTQAGNPNAVDNISDITAAGSYTVQGTIVAKSTRGFIVGDGTGYVYYYNTNYTQADYNIGDMVKLAGSVVVYGGVFEFNNSTTITAATSSNYVAEDPTVLTGEQMDTRVASTTPAQLSNYVQYEGTLSISGSYYNITDIVGATTAKGSISFPINTDFASLDGKHVKVTGYYVGISSSTYYNTMLGSIEETVSSNPSIAAEDVSIEYNATSGAIAFTIDNPVSGGVLTATTESDWLTVGTVGTTVPFTCTANTAASPRTETVTLTYTYNNNQFVNKNITVTQAGNPNTIDNISDITAAGTYTVQGTIVAKSMRGFIVGDGTGYAYYYNQNYDQAEYEVDDMVKLSGAVIVYGGVFEFNSTTEITYASESNYVIEDPTVITGEQMDARVASTTPAQLSSFVQYEGTLSINGTHYNITAIDGATTAQGSISYPIDTDEITALDGKLVKVTGYYVGISSSTYYNTMLGSIEELANATPSIAAADVDIEAAATSGAIEYTINNPVEGGILTASTTSDWLTLGTVGNTVPFTCAANEVTAARTATVTLTYTYNRATVTKDVTVTQAAYVAPFEPATYTLATTIESGKTYIIVGSKTIEEETHYFAMGEQRNNNRGGYEISVDGTTATVETESVHEVIITALEEEGYYSIYDGGYLYAASSGSNHLKTKDELDVNGQWRISIDTLFHIVADSSANRNVMQFNYNNGNPIFSCYGSASQLPVYLYVKDETPSVATQTVALAAGQNWFSSYVDITLNDLKAALVAAAPGTAITIQSQTQNTSYNPSNGRWTGRLTSLDVTKMYVLIVETDCQMTLEGMPIDPVEHPVTIANGANWIAYPLNVDMTLTNAFAGFAVNGDVVQSQVNNASYIRNKWNGQLTGLTPGKGYIYKSSTSESRTFTFPTSAK